MQTGSRPALVGASLRFLLSEGGGKVCHVGSRLVAGKAQRHLVNADGAKLRQPDTTILRRAGNRKGIDKALVEHALRCLAAPKSRKRRDEFGFADAAVAH